MRSMASSPAFLAGNYDITDMYVDATLKIGGKDLEGLAKMIDKLNKLTKDSEVELVFTNYPAIPLSSLRA